ncbi:MAG: hypothetical protein ACXWJZ_17610, partial [Burkholderiaceae bacterium]
MNSFRVERLMGEVRDAKMRLLLAVPGRDDGLAIQETEGPLYISVFTTLPPGVQARRQGQRVVASFRANTNIPREDS